MNLNSLESTGYFSDNVLVVGDDYPKVRWAPIGANSSPECLRPESEDASGDISNEEYQNIKKLSVENEQLTNALMVLTSHIAQVQFRLGQVVNADASDRETMLKSLESFASQGVLDYNELSNEMQKLASDSQVDNYRANPRKLIEQLRTQLDDLERFAYETGEQTDPPTRLLLEKQRLVLCELREKLELNITDLEKLPTNELKKVVDTAVHKFLNPVKINEKLVEQLKTQIVDLERFIDFLHGSETCSEALTKALIDFKRTHQSVIEHSREPCCANNGDDYFEDEHGSMKCVQSSPESNNDKKYSDPNVHFGHSRHFYMDKKNNQTSNHNKTKLNTISLIQRAVTLLTLFAANQFGQSVDDVLSKLKGHHNVPTANKFNSLGVEKAKLHHWGTIRARFEVAVNMVLEQMSVLDSYRQAKFMKTNKEKKHSNKNNATKRKQQHGPISNLVRESPDGRPSRQQQRQQQNPSYSITSNISYQQSEFPGTRITMPVQNVYDVSLCAALEGERPDRLHGNAHLLSSPSATTTYVNNSDDSDSDSYDTDEFLCAEAHRTVLGVVRRYLCSSLRDLIEHGLVRKALSKIDENSTLGLSTANSFLLQPILSCLSSMRHINNRDNSLELLVDDDEIETTKQRTKQYWIDIHAWDVFMKFYQMKNGQRYHDSPARKLSASFELDTINGKVITTRQRLFNAIGTILESRVAYKRSKDLKFKALICVALNEKQLVPWLRLIFKNQYLLESVYEPWSYARSTSFEDALQSLNRLTNLQFDLPYDYSIQTLNDMHDAF